MMAQTLRNWRDVAGKLAAERQQFVSRNTKSPHGCDGRGDGCHDAALASDVQIAHLAAVVFNEPPAGGHLHRTPYIDYQRQASTPTPKKPESHGQKWWERVETVAKGIENDLERSAKEARYFEGRRKHTPAQQLSLLVPGDVTRYSPTDEVRLVQGSAAVQASTAPVPAEGGASPI